MAFLTSIVWLAGVPLVGGIFIAVILSIRWILNATWEAMRYNLPPGPCGLPILGCLGKVDTPTPLHHTLAEMADTYGDMFSMRLGDKLAVIISSYEAMKDTIILQGKKFSGRPKFATFKETKGGFEKGLSLCNMSEKYKQNRKLVHQGFKNLFSVYGQMHTVLPDECNKLIGYLERMGSRPFNPMCVFRKASASLFLRLAFGDNFDYDNDDLLKFITVMEEWFEIAESNNPADYMPLLECLPNARLKKAKAITDNFDDFCKQRLMKGLNDREYSQGYLISSFVQEIAEIKEQLIAAGQQEHESEAIDAVSNRYASVLTDLIGGAFDTVPNTLGWMLLYLYENPQAKEILQEEVRQLTKAGIDDLLDSKKSFYLTAAVYEAIRHCTVAPLALPHATTDEVKALGYDVPKDSLVLVNLWAINHSTDRWTEPDKYDPSRFLINNNELDITKTRAVYSFSCGVRRCPGEKLALVEMQAFIGSLLQRFDIKVSSSPQDMNPVKGLTSKPKPYEIIATRKI